MDFIEQLPASEGHMAILVIVDCLTKQSLFIPTHDSINSPELAQLFLTHMFSKHGMPSHVTSDQGSEFVSHFFRSLGKLLRMELHFTSGYHPEGDGQMERLNQVLEPNEQVSSPEAQHFISDLDDLHTELKRSIMRAQECYQKYADKHCSPAPPLKIGNRVYVKAKYFHTTRPLKKLSKKNLGLYEVIAIPGSHSFTLRLPQHFCSIHPIFHISQLEPAEPDPHHPQ